MGSFFGTTFKKLCIICDYILGLLHLLLTVLLLNLFYCIIFFWRQKNVYWFQLHLGEKWNHWLNLFQVDHSMIFWKLSSNIFHLPKSIWGMLIPFFSENTELFKSDFVYFVCFRLKLIDTVGQSEIYKLLGHIAEALLKKRCHTLLW